MRGAVNDDQIHVRSRRTTLGTAPSCDAFFNLTVEGFVQLTGVAERKVEATFLNADIGLIPQAIAKLLNHSIMGCRRTVAGEDEVRARIGVEMVVEVVECFIISAAVGLVWRAIVSDARDDWDEVFQRYIAAIVAIVFNT